MKIGGVLGIIGSVLALLIGAIGFRLGGIASDVTSGMTSFVGDANSAQLNSQVQSSLAFYRVMSLLTPIMGLVGSGLAFNPSNARLGGILMGLSAVGILFAFGFGALPLVCAILIGIGAFFVLQDQALVVQKTHDDHRSVTTTNKETHASVEFDSNGLGKYKNWEIRKSGDKYHVKQATLGSLKAACDFIDLRA